MNIVVASGKGGVGKSMVASSLAILFSKEKSVVAVDCDVDAQNLGIWLGIKKMDEGKTISVTKTAEINPEKCRGCGKCAEVCRFAAIEKKDGRFSVNRFVCEGCGTCSYVCPHGAIEMKKVDNALAQSAKSEFGFDVLGAQLFPGSTGSGKIVAELRQEAEKKGAEVIVLDSPAGIGCPVTASITNTNYAVLVTEPTPSGLSDLKRVLEVVNHFNIPYGIIINRWDINRDFAEKIGEFAGESLIGKIPYDRKIVDALVEMRPLMETDSPAAGEMRKIFGAIKEKAGIIGNKI